MLMAIWEWLHGYRKWTATEARVEFLKEEHLYHDKEGKDLHYSYVTGRRLVWTDAAGQPHSAPLKQLDDKPPYLLAEGEAETIRYNPANPDQFYCRKLSALRVRHIFTVAFTILAVAAFVVGEDWVRKMLGCSR